MKRRRPRRERLNANVPLNNAIGRLCDGHSAEDVMNALSSILAQAIGSFSETPEHAKRLIDTISGAMKENIDRNWDIEMASRQRSFQ